MPVDRRLSSRFQFQANNDAKLAQYYAQRSNLYATYAPSPDTPECNGREGAFYERCLSSQCFEFEKKPYCDALSKLQGYKPGAPPTRPKRYLAGINRVKNQSTTTASPPPLVAPPVAPPRVPPPVAPRVPPPVAPRVPPPVAPRRAAPAPPVAKPRQALPPAATRSSQCPEHNPDDPRLRLDTGSAAGRKEVLRHFINTTKAPRGTFTAVMQNRLRPEDHELWHIAEQFYNNGCVMPEPGPPCNDRTRKEYCLGADRSVFDPERGFLCRWNLSSSTCEPREPQFINFQ
jgi:hypothetical protein